MCFNIFFNPDKLTTAKPLVISKVDTKELRQTQWQFAKDAN